MVWSWCWFLFLEDKVNTHIGLSSIRTLPRSGRKLAVVSPACRSKSGWVSFGLDRVCSDSDWAGVNLPDKSPLSFLFFLPFLISLILCLSSSFTRSPGPGTALWLWAGIFHEGVNLSANDWSSRTSCLWFVLQTAKPAPRSKEQQTNLPSLILPRLVFFPRSTCLSVVTGPWQWLLSPRPCGLGDIADEGQNIIWVAITPRSATYLKPLISIKWWEPVLVSLSSFTNEILNHHSRNGRRHGCLLSCEGRSASCYILFWARRLILDPFCDGIKILEIGRWWLISAWR